MSARDLQVRRASRMDCRKFLIDIHYAGRFPSVSHAFGLYDGEELVGIVTYGVPPSSTLRDGVAGSEFASSVLELNRLALKYNRKNEASMLVGASLRNLGRSGNFIVVSYADISEGHTGFVYQACNFTYHGLSAKRTDWKVRGMEHLHNYTIGDTVRGEENRAAALRAIHGDNFYLQDRPRKHRYIFLCGSPHFKREAKAAIRYPQEPYPKAVTARPERRLRSEREGGPQPRLL